jgi:hypothetical protein
MSTEDVQAAMTSTPGTIIPGKAITMVDLQKLKMTTIHARRIYIGTARRMFPYSSANVPML